MSLTFSEKETITRLIGEGVVRSADRLGKLSRAQWTVMSSNTDEVPVVRLMSWFHSVKGEHLGVVLRADGDIPTDAVMIFSSPDAQVVADAVTSPWGERMKRLENLIELTMGEVGNILAQSAVGVLADEFEKTIIFSVPRVKRGAKVELLAEALERYDGRKDILLMSDVEMHCKGLAADCTIVLVCGSASLHRLSAGRV